jgi:hypothetical protein
MPERFDRKRKYALGKMSGKANIQKNLQELGLTLNNEELKKVTQRIIELGDKKERVTKDDLPFIISDVLDSDTHHQKVFVKSYVLTHAKGLMPSTTLSMEIDGEFFETNAIEVEYIMPDNIHYLEDSGIMIEGIKFYGSPVTPWFHNWAFNRYRNTTSDGEYMPTVYKGIKEHWDEIPDNTDILLTHGPSADALDLLCPKFRRHNEHPNVGDIDLSIALKRVKPKVLAFGHIHETYGTEQVGDILHINSSVMNEDYACVNQPITIEYTTEVNHIYTNES